MRPVQAGAALPRDAGLRDQVYCRTLARLAVLIPARWLQNLARSGGLGISHKLDPFSKMLRDASTSRPGVLRLALAGFVVT